VTTIDNYAFYRCTGLTGVDLTNVTTLGYNWCYDCTNLSSVIIGSQTYISNDWGWEHTGPAVGCTIYAPNEAAANTFKTNVIGVEYAAKWAYQQI
jgi:hypothetical protein